MFLYIGKIVVALEKLESLYLRTIKKLVYPHPKIRNPSEKSEQ
jgi:hypothetical protein